MKRHTEKVARTIDGDLSYRQVLRMLVPFAKAYKRTILLSLLLTFAGAGLAQVTPLIMQYVVTQVSGLVASSASLESGWYVLIFASAILLGKEFLTLLVNIGGRYLGEKLKVKISADLSNRAYAHVLSLRIAYFDQPENEPSKITKRLDRGAEALAKVVKNLFADILPLLTTAAAALVVMYLVNVWVGLTSTLVVPVYFALSWAQARTQKGVRTAIQDIQENRAARMSGALVAIKLIKSYTREAFEARKHNAISDELVTLELGHHRTNHFYDSFKLFADRLGAALVIIVTAVFVLQGQMSIGAIMLHLLLYTNITAPIRDLHRIYDETNEAIAYAGGFFSILRAEPEEGAATSSLTAGSAPGTLTVRGVAASGNRLCGEIEFKGVSFSYMPGEEVLHRLNLTIPSYKTTALVGLSGAGKSTVAALLGRFYDPDCGKLLLDGTDIGAYALDYLRSNVGFVLQQTHIFFGTILENIRYGKLDATDEEVVLAAQKAGLHNEVMALPRGYASSASKLSGGQMQRIAIARVFLKDPPVLVLDEPTASLDALAAEHIKSALEAVRQERTVLIISHNLASIVDSDRIYVMKDGSIIGEGIHKSLYSSNEHYHTLIDANIQNLNLNKLLPVQELAA